MNKLLKEILDRKTSVPFFGVHDALSSKIAENEGFEALWLSGLGLSTVNGVRDASELSSDYFLRAIDSITQACSIPMLVDADTGFGNFNTARNFAKKAIRCGAAGLCIEDNQYPKLNSFASSGQKLVSKNEFSGKIRSILDATDGGIYLVARTESFIVGGSVDEAIDRANCYVDAGANAILVHSKLDNFSQIKSFMSQWGLDIPVLIVPTTYDLTCPSIFAENNISGVIWANQALRAAAMSMSMVCRTILKDKSPAMVKTSLVSVDDIFKLIDYAELSSAEKKYS